MDKSQEVLFLSSLGLYSDQINYLMETYEDPIQPLGSPGDFKDKTIEKKASLAYQARAQDFEDYLSFMEANKISYISIFHEAYPKALRLIDQPPAILYYKGQLVLDRPAISVVGSRKCTEYGQWACEMLVEGLADYGVSIISGLALGIDKLAHETALDNGLYSLGVLGCGVDRIYPASNRSTFLRMEEEGGGIVSEFTLGSSPLAHHFPIRNRIISALGLGLLVIEAQDKSGTLITASYAADQGKDVFALPGNINSLFSTGTNKLIRDGAKLVTSAEDIIEEFPGLARVKEAKEEVQADLSQLSPDEALIYQAIASQARSTDELARSLKMPVAQLMSSLTMLELRGLVTELDGRWNIN